MENTCIRPYSCLYHIRKPDIAKDRQRKRIEVPNLILNTFYRNYMMANYKADFDRTLTAAQKSHNFSAKTLPSLDMAQTNFGCTSPRASERELGI